MVQFGYLFALGVACLLGVGIAYVAWANRETTGARALVAVALATVVWTAGTMGLVLAMSPTAELRWLQASYLGMVVAPISFILFALRYTGWSQYVPSLLPWGLGILGSGFLALVWTNPYHELYWAHIEYTAAAPSGIATTPAAGFWGFVVFTYVLLLVGSVLLTRYALTAPHLYRSQSIALLCGVAAPWAANIPHVLQYMSADLTPVALSVTTAALWGAMSRYRLADLGPIALRTVFESVSTGIFVLDRHDRVIDVNTAGTDMLGISEDVIGEDFRAVVPDDAFHEPPQETGDQSDVIAYERESDSEASAARQYRVQLTPIDSAEGHQDGRLVVIDDVTDQYRRQQQLERQNERLEAFTSVVSHDLRNPLNVASGNVTLAQENGNADHLERAHRALGRMETLIDDLLALAHGGTEVTDPAPVDLGTLATDAWRTVDTKEATLISRTERTLLADRSRLHQLLENLIRNAVEHGGETVTVTIGDNTGGFYVADDGPGIPVEERDAVFETGYSTREDGTGFGLNIVREIADAHGWTVTITESAEGGARFEVTNVQEAGAPPAARTE